MKPSQRYAPFFLITGILFLIACYFYSHPFHKNTPIPDFSCPSHHIAALESVPAELSLFASGACLMDTESGRILYGKEENIPRPMASTTKIMTCLLALEHSTGEENVTFSSRAVSMPKVHLGAPKGTSFYMKDLLYSLMLESHNDTAVAIAEQLSGSVSNFANAMNQKAKELGMSKTCFVTPNGLDADGHQSSPSDMCRLASYACKNSQFLSIVQTPSKTIQDCQKKHCYALTNHDAFLSSYKGALGIKTGFTGKAGYCFVGAAKRKNLTFVSCVLASGWPPDKSRKWHDTKALMDFGFSHYEKKEIQLQDFSKKRIRVCDGISSYTFLKVPQIPSLPLASFETIDITYNIPSELQAPLHASRPIGSVDLYINQKLYNSYPVYPVCDMEKTSFSHYLHEVFLQFTAFLFKK